MIAVRPFARPLFHRSRSAFPGYTPQQICRARGWDGQPISVAPVRLGYLSLGGTTPDSDIAAQAALFGLKGPKVTRVGTPQASDPGGANVENNLDLWSAWIYETLTGTQPELVIASANNDASGMPTAVSLLAQAGVEVPSISWGSPEASWGRAACLQMQQAVQQGRQLLPFWPTAASGDNSKDDGTSGPAADCPCSIPEVLAIGGTNLQMISGQWLDRAWGDGRPGDDGGGGGYSALFSMPSYQTGIVAGSMRGIPDFAENADPATGYMMISDGQRMCVGGTSGAAPTAAGLLAVARGAMKLKGLPIPADLHTLLYANRATVFADITTGSDGWPATVGWDPCTGNGRLILPNLIAALLGQAAAPPVVQPPVNQPPVVPVPAQPGFDDVMHLMERLYAGDRQDLQILLEVQAVGDALIRSGALARLSRRRQEAEEAVGVLDIW